MRGPFTSADQLTAFLPADNQILHDHTHFRPIVLRIESRNEIKMTSWHGPETIFLLI